MTLSGSVHIAANGIISFFLMAEQHSIVYVYHIFFIHPSVDGLLRCFLVLAVVNSVAVNVGVQASFEPCFRLDICPGMGLLVSYGSSIFIF